MLFRAFKYISILFWIISVATLYLGFVHKYAAGLIVGGDLPVVEKPGTGNVLWGITRWLLPIVSAFLALAFAFLASVDNKQRVGDEE